MKRTLLYILIIGFACLQLEAQIASPIKSQAGLSPSGDEFKIQQVVINWTPNYLAVSKGKLMPVYMNFEDFTAYKWKDVILDADKVLVPDRIGTRGLIPYQGIPADKVRIIGEVPPPIRYLKSEDGKYMVGYYPSGSPIFFQWEGFYLDRAQLPEKAEEMKLIVKPDGGVVKKEWLSIIPPPPEFARPIQQQMNVKGGPEASEKADVFTKERDNRPSEKHDLDNVMSANTKLVSSTDSLNWQVIVGAFVAVLLGGAGFIWLLRKPSNS